MKKVWTVQAGGATGVESLADIEALLLRQRGIMGSSDAFFKPLYDRDIHDPLLLSDMALALDRIYGAIARRERIMVYGDYDVDGVSSTALLIIVLQRLGAVVAPFIPHRFEDGYGLNQATAERLKNEFDVLITVDCGITSVKEIAWLKQQQKDVIIIDHHEIVTGPLPPAYAIVHPRHPQAQYPFGWLCAAGVVWKVCQALLKHPSLPFEHDPDEEKWLLDLALLGTVADMVPMVGENRLLVQFGLEVLRRTKRPGLKALLNEVKLTPADLDAEALSWRIIPRLNAAGKMDHAQPALDLLLTTDADQATRILAQLNRHNNDRQSVTTKVFQEAEKQITDPTTPFIFVHNTSWPAGVVGLVASRLSQKFMRPAIVVGGNGQHGVGSARSPVTTNVLELLRLGQKHLMKLGGHARAAGFSVEDALIETFHQTLSEARPPKADTTSEIVLGADMVINQQLVEWNLLHLSEQFAPFGEGNKMPVFIAQGLRIGDIRPVGKTKEHAKFMFIVNERPLDGIGFGLAKALPPTASHADALFSVTANEYRGRKSLQLKVLDILPAGESTIREHV